MTVHDLNGKVALVTGGARGLGREHALTLARAGAAVGVLDVGDRRPAVPGYALSESSDLAHVIEEIEALGSRAVPLEADVRVQDDLDRAVEALRAELGEVDILVANAGVAIEPGPAWEVSQEHWDLLLGVNLTGVWHACKAVIPPMIERGAGGRLVFVSSCAALKGTRGAGPYAASKAGVISLAQALALELAEYDITVNCVCPGTVLTGINKHMAQATDAWIDMQAIQRPLEPRDIAQAVLYLASDAARFVTGVTLPVDGGFSIK
jgi:NAD(P)-dependent dehydrogenase (short-subunit alcohol dehydrogenase family)